MYEETHTHTCDPAPYNQKAINTFLPIPLLNAENRCCLIFVFAVTTSERVTSHALSAFLACVEAAWEQASALC